MQSMPCALQSAAPAISLEASTPRGGKISTKDTNLPAASFAPSWDLSLTGILDIFATGFAAVWASSTAARYGMSCRPG